ncbi:MAG: DUF397 domain-containing protein [Pseudonocardiaceae bacterium]
MTHQHAPDAPGLATQWRKSSYSQAQSDCVEITTDVPGRVGIRDSTLGATSPVLTFTAPAWRALLTNVKDGEFDH